jgi:hypothetical protein
LPSLKKVDTNLVDFVVGLNFQWEKVSHTNFHRLLLALADRSFYFK